MSASVKIDNRYPSVVCATFCYASEIKRISAFICKDTTTVLHCGECQLQTCSSIIVQLKTGSFEEPIVLMVTFRSPFLSHHIYRPEQAHTCMCECVFFAVTSHPLLELATG